MKMPRRDGFTLLELLLALSLSAVVALLIGGLIQLYLLNENRGRENVRQAQVARAVLSMIAEDIRTTVRYQPFDTSGLQQMLSGSAASMLGMPSGMAGGGTSGGGGGSSIGGAPAGAGAPTSGNQNTASPSSSTGGTGSLPTGNTGGPSNSSGGGRTPNAGGGTSINFPSGSGSGSAGNSSGGASSNSATSYQTSVPPGVYGAENSIEIDVSRMPRPDEYTMRPGDLSIGTLGDMPSDIKTVSYYVQSPRSDGILDPLSRLTSETSTSTSGASVSTNGGLVRRSLDRAVTQYAYQVGNTTQLLRTGELIAPEVLGIEFSYFSAANGWQTQWDSSTLGLPNVVKVTIAMQSESMARSNPITPGLSLSSITSAMAQEYGIQFYSTNVIIPGAGLLTAPQSQSETGSTSNGMSSLGL
ncbi:MAG: prepilin-type N-terminal cleavage/methylation domain-containing protein [Pirellula sp.]|jgi:prepilin-type N-terminal cleavage/methylation domain-containing protein